MVLDVVSSALAFSILLGAAVPPATLDWPHGSISELLSPDGQRMLCIEPALPGVRPAELWLKHSERSGDGKRVVAIGSTGRAMWFPDGRHFLITDRDSSSSMNSYVYDSDATISVDVRAVLFRGDPALKSLESRHFYVEAERLIDADTFRVAVYGHTDETPVQCFRLIYAVSRSSNIRKLSSRVSPATAKTCDVESPNKVASSAAILCKWPTRDRHRNIAARVLRLGCTIMRSRIEEAEGT